MDFVKKFGLWIAALVLIIAAVAFYMLVVRKMSAKAKVSQTTLEQRRKDLEGIAKQTDFPTEARIEAEKQNTERRTRQIGSAEALLARQPRRCNTRLFFENENELGGQTIEVTAPMKWLGLYEEHNKQLAQKINDCPFKGLAFATMNPWGNTVPTREQMNAATEYYWFQKDMVDLFSCDTEKDLQQIISYASAGGKNFPTKPADLVINPNAALLEAEFLRGQNEKDLQALLVAILLNEKEEDLAMIFNRLFPTSLPWQRPPDQQSAPSVLGLTMDARQQAFLEKLVPPNAPDLYNNQRFVTYVYDLRTVRYRSDVIRLLENHGFESVADQLRRGTPEDYARLFHEINTSWNRAQMAQAINAIVSIRTEEDYNVLVANHNPKIADISNYSLTWPFGPLGETAGEVGPRPDVYYEIPIGMKVRLPFDRVPIFIRHILNNTYLPQVTVIDVAPVQLNPMVPSYVRIRRAGAPETPTSAQEPSGDFLAGINEVNITIEMKARLFKPLLPKVEAAAKAAEGATP